MMIEKPYTDDHLIDLLRRTHEIGNYVAGLADSDGAARENSAAALLREVDSLGKFLPREVAREVSGNYEEDCERARKILEK